MLHVFDMDGTLLPGTSASVEIARVAGGHAWLEGLEEDFRHGRLDNRGFAAALHQGWRDLTPQSVATAFHSAPKLQDIRATVEAVHEHGGYAVLISMSPDFFVSHFLDYGFDAAIGSRFPSLPFTSPLDPSGILTFQDKPRLVTDLCRRWHVAVSRVVAYGDSQSDVPLFAVAATSVAVNADEHVDRLASVSYQGNSLIEAYRLGLQAHRPT